MIDPPGATGVQPDIVPGTPVGSGAEQIILDAINYDTTPASGKDSAYLNAVLSDIGSLLYKNDGTESGSLSSNYDVVNKVVSGGDWISGTLRWNGGSPVADPTQPLWAVLKDGAAGFVVWDLSNAFGNLALGWDGQMDINFSNVVFPHIDQNGNPDLTKDPKGISGFQIWGQSTTLVPPPIPGPVPEPTSMMVYGLLGICGLVTRRRMRVR
ncbi:PEP-CTERM sorting domain-containing protein [Rhodopirellula sp. JC639]|uniref:PEP-CTERM sorting domain-containing protein n=1 Tax=Stieleria mannarensis TaxID=2755585 RepID=UPI0015FFC8E1|nr:PEP-CTERM sorting domain-containing protein [Rhodopirellula sp. JC639]